MKQRKESGLDFVIDQLTNSIQNVVTGDSFGTEVSVLTAKDLSEVTKRNGWLFNWKGEIKDPVKDVYKLTIVHNPSIIQGLISLEVKVDHVLYASGRKCSLQQGKGENVCWSPG